MRDATGQHPAGRRPAGEAADLRGDPRRARREPRSRRAPAREALEQLLQARHRRRPDGRQHAGARRLRARGDDPPAPALPEDARSSSSPAVHLTDLDRLQGLRVGRRRLRLGADRARDPARQGRASSPSSTARREELERLNRELERRVAERTAELEAAMESLLRERGAGAGRAPRGRAGQPAEGRVPRDALARAAHAAQRDPRLGAPAAHGRARRRERGAARSRSSSATRALQAQLDRRPARRVADHHRQAAARASRPSTCAPVVEAALDDRAARRPTRRASRSTRDLDAAPAPVLGRRRPAAAGRLEPALERGQVHAARAAASR